MATIARRSQKPGGPIELHSGDRMSREEFHRVYRTMPEDFKAELIGGMVHT